MNKHLTGLAAGLALMLAPAAGLASLTLAPADTLASIQTYPDYTGNTVMFTNMQETDLPNGGGIYFTQPVGTADSLAFVDGSFNANQAITSAAPIDGTFQTDVHGLTSGSISQTISQIIFNVSGDYSLASFATPSAHVQTTATATVTAVDGQTLATPIVITQPVFTGDFVPALGGFTLGKSWNSGNVLLDFTGHGITGAVTGVTVALQTKLWTDAAPTDTALIAQKMANITVIPGDPTVVPVPAAAGGAIGLLGGFMLFEFLGRSRRRRLQVEHV